MQESPDGWSVWELVKAGAYEQALPWFQEQCDVDRSRPAFTNLGTLYLLLHRYELAAFVSGSERVEPRFQADFLMALRALRAGDRATFVAQTRAAASNRGAYLEHEYYLARWEVEHDFPFLPFGRETRHGEFTFPPFGEAPTNGEADR
jgi:hypothetical protein